MPASLARPVGSQFLYLPLCPQRKFGLASTPLRLFISPVGVPSGTAEAGDSTNRDKFGKTSQPRTPPGSHYDGRRHPPTDRTAAGKPRSQIARPSAAPRGGRNFVAAPPATGPSPKKNLARRSLSARLGKFTRFNSSLKQSISLLRRGARGLFRSPAGISLDCAFAQQVKSLLRRAGDQNSIRLRSSRAGSAYAAEAVPSGTRYGPFGRENSLWPRAGGNWSKQLCVVWPISYSSSRARASYPDELELPLRRTGGASRHAGLAIRARKQSLAARHSNRAVSTLTKARAVTRTRPPRGRCLPALGTGHLGEKNRF